MIAAGAIYHMVPRLWHTEIHSSKLVNLHFWLATIGIVIYIVAMWISGIMQGLMWRDYNQFGTLTYTFAESVAAMHPYYVLRTVGGFIYTIGALVMLYNVVMTIRLAGAEPRVSPAPAQV